MTTEERWAPWLGALGNGRLGSWVAGLVREPRRLKELGLALAIVFFVANRSLTISQTYPTYFAGIVALAVLVLMLENQEKTLYLLLWFSTVYLMLKATLLGWSGLAFLFKEGFLALLIAFWVFQMVMKNESVRDTPLNKPIFVLIGWLVLECFNPNTGGFLTILDDLRFWLGPIAVYFLTVHLVDTRAKLERAIKVVFTYALLESLYGVAQQAMPGDLLVTLGADPNNYFYFYQGLIRSFSTMGTAAFAMFSSMFPPLAFFYASQQKSVLHRWLFYAAALSFVVGVLFSLVRVGWVAVLVTIIMYSLVTKRTTILATLAIGVVVVMTLASGYMRYKVEGMLNPEEDISVQTRIDIVQIVSKGVVFRVFGYGLGTFIHNRFGTGLVEKTGYGTATENWYLMTSLELGWVGVGILFWIWWQVYVFAYRGYKGGLRTRRYREMSIGLAGALLAIDVARLGGPAGYYPPDSWHYWFFAALLMTVPKADAELFAEEQALAAEAAFPAPRISAAALVPEPRPPGGVPSAVLG